MSVARDAHGALARGRPSVRRLPAALALILMLPGCGARSELDVFEDTSDPRNSLPAQSTDAAVVADRAVAPPLDATVAPPPDVTVPPPPHPPAAPPLAAPPDAPRHTLD